VFITKNLSVKMGLVNGTIGIVHDIIVNSSGVPVVVLVKVRRAQEGRDGYSGPSFLQGVEGVNDLTEAIVPVGMQKASLKQDEQTHERQQFPLMLAWTVTVHKAQGLTLDRVTYDAGYSLDGSYLVHSP
jgi:ATP-dependent exoDNAse (exonuclease V) alpha subunit